jgi:hypothetical protein
MITGLMRASLRTLCGLGWTALGLPGARGPSRAPGTRRGLSLPRLWTAVVVHSSRAGRSWGALKRRRCSCSHAFRRWTRSLPEQPGRGHRRGGQADSGAAPGPGRRNRERLEAARRAGPGRKDTARRPPIVPLSVLGFLACVTFHTTDVLPAGALALIAQVQVPPSAPRCSAGCRGCRSPRCSAAADPSSSSRRCPR